MKHATAYSYERISTEEQSNFSLRFQNETIQEYADKNNITIIESFRDDGYSAKDFNRPAWKRLEIALKKHKVDYLIVAKYDRLIRNMLEGLVFIDKLENKLGVTLISVRENYGVSPFDPYFRKQRNDMLNSAEHERGLISWRSRGGVHKGKKEGYYLHKAPFGYYNFKDDKKMPQIGIDIEKKEVIKNIFDDFLSGYSFTAIRKRAEEKGFTGKHKEVIKRTLLNPVYGGLIKVPAFEGQPEQIVKGLHDGIVPEETYWKAYYQLQDQLKPQVQKVFDENLPLRGFLICDKCGAIHTGAKAKGRSKYYFYYWCNTCKGKTYNAEKVDTDISYLLNGLSLSHQLIEAIRIETEIQVAASMEERKVQLNKEIREYSELKTKLDKLEKKYIEEDLDKETYKKWHSIYTEELNKKGVLLSDLKRTESESTMILNTIDYFTDLNYLYKKAAVEEKQQFLKGVFPAGLITLEKGYRTAFITSMFAPNATKLEGLVEIRSGDNASTFSKIPTWGGSWNPTQTNLTSFLKLIERIIKKAA